MIAEQDQQLAQLIQFVGVQEVKLLRASLCSGDQRRANKS
jgi:hypothetical protein